MKIAFKMKTFRNKAKQKVISNQETSIKRSWIFISMKPLIGYRNTSKFDEDNNDKIDLQNFLKLKTEFGSTISFVIAKFLISKIFSSVLKSRSFSLFNSEPHTSWRIILAHDIDLHPRTFDEHSFKTLKE